MPRVRLFAAARDAAGTGKDVLPGDTVGEVLAAATAAYGPAFAEVLTRSRVWVDGEPAEAGDPVAPDAEVAVLPPVSGGATSPDDVPAAAPVAVAPSRQPAASTAPRRSASGAGPARGAATSSHTPMRAMTRDPSLLVSRLFEPVDTAGPKALLAVAWVLLQVLALAGGPLALGLLFGVVAGVAGLHAAKAWRAAGERPSRAVAGLAPLIVPVLAAVDPSAAGAALLVATAASVALPGRRGVDRMASAGTALRCWLGPALAAMSVVLVARFETSAAASLLLLIAGYDVAAYLWGAGSAAPLVGRVIGMVTVGVLTFSLSVLQMVTSLPPFQTTGAVWVFGGLAATLCPLGQLLASAFLPAASAPAPALRRLDSLLLAGPAWALALWGYVV